MAQVSPSKKQGMLEKLLAPLSGFLQKTTSVVGIDIGSSSIKIIQLKKKGGRAILETYGEIALGPYAGRSIGQATKLPDEKLQEALADLVRESNVTAQEAGLSVPLSSSLVLTMSMPAASRKQLAEMVPIEARKYIPIPISEVLIDWNIIPDEPGGIDEMGQTVDSSGGAVRRQLKVLVAAIHNTIVSVYQEVASKTSLSIGFLEIEVFSTIRSLLRRERAPVLILDMGAGSSKVSIVENGVPLSTHVINRGAQDITIALSRSQGLSVLKAEELKRTVGLVDDPAHPDVADTANLILRGIFTEANKVLLAYEKSANKTVKKVILSGGGALIKGVEDLAAKSFDAEVERADPFAQIETPAFLESVLADVGPNFAVAAGIALRKLQEI